MAFGIPLLTEPTHQMTRELGHTHDPRYSRKRSNQRINNTPVFRCWRCSLRYRHTRASRCTRALGTRFRGSSTPRGTGSPTSRSRRGGSRTRVRRCRQRAPRPRQRSCSRSGTGFLSVPRTPRGSSCRPCSRTRPHRSQRCMLTPQRMCRSSPRCTARRWASSRPQHTSTLLLSRGSPPRRRPRRNIPLGKARQN
jgi:hypothetical protein